jgi:hypothetical protein
MWHNIHDCWVSLAWRHIRILLRQQLLGSTALAASGAPTDLARSRCSDLELPLRPAARRMVIFAPPGSRQVATDTSSLKSTVARFVKI